MANLSDASVDIVVDKVGQELLDYINITNKGLTDYVIVYDGYDTHENENGHLVISGHSSGRWAYSNNLEGYFNPERVKEWLGVSSDYSWVQDEEKKKEYQKHSNEQYEAYLKLIEALKTKGGFVEINYTDCDPAMGWTATGSAMLETQDGVVSFSVSEESGDLTISGYADEQGLTESEALEYLHGDEAVDAYDKYIKKCEKEGTKPVDIDTWYDELYGEE